MPTRKPASLVAAALAASPLTWPELHAAFGRQAVEYQAGYARVHPLVRATEWVFFDFCLDRYSITADCGLLGGLVVGQLLWVPAALGPAENRHLWEDALRRHFLQAEAGECPAWNRLRLFYQLSPAGEEPRTATLHEATTWWDEDLATLSRQRQAWLQLSKAAQLPLAHEARLAWATGQRTRLEAAIVQALLPANTPPEPGSQMLSITYVSQGAYPLGSYSSSRTVWQNGEPVHHPGVPAPALLWLVWQYCRLRAELLPKWDVAAFNLKDDGHCTLNFILNGNMHTRTGQVQADGQYVPAASPPVAPPPPGPALLRDLQDLYATLAQALAEARPAPDYAILLSWLVGANNTPELTCSNDSEREYPAEEDVFTEALEAQLRLFAEASLAAQAPWHMLYVLLPPDNRPPESGYLTREEQPRPEGPADLRPYYTQLRDALEPQLPATWHTLRVAAGWGDGLTPYRASVQLANGEQLAVQVQHSGRALVALAALYTYGLHAADCDWQHVELTFQRAGQLTADFYYMDSNTSTGVAAQPEATVEEWLPDGGLVPAIWPLP